MMENVAVFIDGYPIKISPSILNFLELLQPNFRITLFHRNVKPQYLPSELEGIEMVEVENREAYEPKAIWRYLKHVLVNKHLLKQQTIVTKYLNNKTGNASVANAVGLYKQHKRNKRRSQKMLFDQFICFDLEGLHFQQELFAGNSKPIVFYSLEIRLKEDNETYFLEEETRKNGSMKLVSHIIIQSEERLDYLLQNYGLKKDMPAFILPVTYKGAKETVRTNFFYERLSIDKNKKICLHVGGIIPELNSIEMALAFKHLPDWTLVFQGYKDEAYFEKFNEAITKEGLTNIYVSDFFADKPEDLSTVVSSCHAGIAWYADISENMRTAAYSSGKISMYLKCGLPVVANNYPSFKRLVEGNECGVCMGSFDELPQALTKVEENYSSMQQQAFALYEKQFRFEQYQETLLAFLN